MSGESFPILSVDDLPAVERFYTQLGFRRSFAFPPDGEPGFVTLERDGTAIGIAVRQSNDVDAFAYWVYVDDVDAAHAALVSSGATSVAEPADQPWGERVATVRDPAGNVVHLGATTSSSDE